MRLNRRTFLQCIVVTAGAVPACASHDTPDVVIGDGQRFFPQSVASGDPRSDGFVLWTRVVDATLPEKDLALTLEVATDLAFQTVVARQSGLLATFLHDNTLKVKLVGLAPRTVYFYRFIYEKNGPFASRTGRTKTAPAPTDDVPVRFAVANCQDFVGRFYNSWQYFTQLEPDLDFVIFLGDYIYETNGDPAFQSASGSRAVTLSDPASALALGTAGAPFLAAQSLSNYRDIYKTYRSDPFLQRAHEKYPFVFIWDDHEYSDDCHGATATYSNGRTDETNIPRRQNAERAFFEYIPLDSPGSGAGAVDIEALLVYPDTRIYRDLVFGKNLRLLVADYRTYRPDHLIPEDAYPAAVVLDQDALRAAQLDTAFSSDAFAYVNIDDPPYSAYKTLLIVAYRQLAGAAGLDAASAEAAADRWVKGNLSLAYVNAVAESLMLPTIDTQEKPRGLAWVHMGKSDLFARQGSRYIVVKDTLDAYAAALYQRTSGESENAFGKDQQAWLAGALAGPESWKVLVSSVSMTSLVFDLRDKTDVADPRLRNRYYLDADMWDGFPTRRLELLGSLAAAPGGKALVVSGDIHAAFASVEERVPCLTSPAISSETIKHGARGVAAASGFDETTAVYGYVVTNIDETFRAGNPGIKFSDTDSNGFMIVSLGADTASAMFYLLPSAETQTDYAARPADLAAMVTKISFDVAPGAIVPSLA